ncbi:MAG: family transporter substrate-binding protein [Acidimicrobiales bacterium]|jgi:basic membrane protein A|nr:family transporter substrate-binding protein [Acidimicrobiales bacterium]
MRKSNKMLSALTITTVLGLTAAACGSDSKSTATTKATTAPTTAGSTVDTTAASTAETTTGDSTAASTDGSTAASTDGSTAGSEAATGSSLDPATVTACEVTDTGGVDDKGFNQSAYAGVQTATSTLGTKGDLLESKTDADYAPNIQSFLSKDCSVIITVGFNLDSATATAAKANPDQQFAIIDSAAMDNNGTPDDFSDDVALPNVRPLLFNTADPSFMAGYLAAGMTKTGTVATYGGIDIPPVDIFMTGFLNGVNYYNAQKSTSVKVLGWDGKTGSFAGDFTSLDKGTSLARGFADEGADIVFPVAGGVGLGTAAYATSSGKISVIGVDTDQFVSNPQDAAVYLTSVLKHVDNAVLDTITNVVNTGKPGASYLGTLENEGVGLADFHDFDSKVPQALKDELTQIQADLISGKIKSVES